MKKTLALLLTLALLVALVACTDSPPAETSSRSDSGVAEITENSDTTLPTSSDPLSAGGGNAGTESSEPISTDPVTDRPTDTEEISVTTSTKPLQLGYLTGYVNRVDDTGFLMTLNGRWFYVTWEREFTYCEGDLIHVTYVLGEEWVTENATLTDADGLEHKGEILKRVLTVRDEGNNSLAVGKPVIYLYPEAETEVFVRVNFDGIFTETIPEHGDGWTAVASPDGTVTVNGVEYPYLFWEGLTDSSRFPLETGYCVAGAETEAFLSRILRKMGLNEKETADFLEYWAPRMKDNPYNVIAFQTEAYEAMAPLTVSPSPDSVLRIFMTYGVSDCPVELEAPEIEPFERKGFTLVEWGGGAWPTLPEVK